MFHTYAAWIKCITLFTTILKISAILNSNSGELTAQLFSLSYFLLKCLCKILWKHGEGMSYVLLFFSNVIINFQMTPISRFIIVFKIYPHEPLASGVEVM